MFQISKLKSFINLKTLSVFALTILLGLTFNSIFGRYIFRYWIVETFTLSEAKAKLDRRVTATCFEKSGLISGTVISYQRDSDRQISIKIKWDKPLMGKFDTVDFGKETYQNCFGEMDANK